MSLLIDRLRLSRSRNAHPCILTPVPMELISHGRAYELLLLLLVEITRNLFTRLRRESAKIKIASTPCAVSATVRLGLIEEN